MSDKNNIFENDLLMRSILEGGQEEVPARVWDAVSEKLDKVEGKKSGNVVRLWWRRAGVAVSAIGAAAAVIVTVLMTERQQDTEIEPMDAQGDMIAVIEPAVVNTQDNEIHIDTDAESHETFERVVSKTSGAELLAYAPEASIQKDDHTETTDQSVLSASDEITVVHTPSDITANSETKYENEYYDWAEETPVRQTKASFVISGITGAANTKSGGNSGILKAPAVVVAPTETGIREKESQTTYGIPVSIGAGVRFELSPRWSLGVGLNYTNLTRTLSGTYTHINENGGIDEMITSKIRNSQHYLGLPVNVYLSIVDSKKITFYTYAGGTLERCLSDKYHILTNNLIHKEAVKGVQLSANIGLGLEYTLGQHIGLYIDPSLRYYFDCDQPRSIRTAQPLMFGAEVGLRFSL